MSNNLNKTVESLIKNHSLPVLFAAAMQHPDLSGEISRGIGNFLNDEVPVDADSPLEYANLFQAAIKLGELFKTKVDAQPNFILDDYTGGPAVRPLLDEILMHNDAAFAPLLVQIFEILKEQTELDRLDLLERMQDYAFTRTIEFEHASDAFKRKTRSEQSREVSERSEPNETSNAATA